MKLALAGATGLVGSTMLRVLEEHHFPVETLMPAASPRSVGSSIQFRGESVTVQSLEATLAARPDLALFSAGGDVSREWAPRFAEAGIPVIDNSSAFRLDADIPLIVPEVNAHVLKPNDRIIANPNCSTIQMVVVLDPLNRAFGLRRVVVSTYQSVTGTGYKAVDQLDAETWNRLHPEQPKTVKRVYPHPIDVNALPHIDSFLENGYTKEEMKMIRETRKIMELPELAITATTVRIPVLGGHSESVNAEFRAIPNLSAVQNILRTAPGVVLRDDPEENIYPMPVEAQGRDEVFVGRLRLDESKENTLNLWIVADNLRKGAATNAVQIALILAQKGWIN
ncbi:MAG: aspartate-semialdehyde dehydrogenase [Bacteroidetes bacterium]|nr:aspartate-semialdehyde dehydrogenase [Bacteroidota bacterium]